MNSNLFTLIQQFNETQAKAVEYMRNEGIPIPVSDDEWNSKSVHYIRSKNYKFKQFRIRPHGIGVEMKTESFEIDFDFGSKGEIDGFDSFRLAMFSERNKWAVQMSDDDIIVELEKSLLIGEVRKSDYINMYLNENPTR